MQFSPAFPGIDDRLMPTLQTDKFDGDDAMNYWSFVKQHKAYVTMRVCNEEAMP